MADEIEMKYSAFFSVWPEGETSGPYSTREEAEQDIEPYGAVGVQEGDTVLRLERLPEEIEDICYFTGKSPELEMTVSTEESSFAVVMSEEVARDLYEALGKLLG